MFAAQGETLTRETEQLTDVAATLEEEVAIQDEEIALLEQTRRALEEELEVLIVSGLAERMDWLRRAIAAERVDFEDLPASLRERLVDGE